MRQQVIFNTDRLAKQFKIAKSDYEQLKSSVREEFPNDEMMYQLHLMRSIRSFGAKKREVVKQEAM